MLPLCNLRIFDLKRGPYVSLGLNKNEHSKMAIVINLTMLHNMRNRKIKIAFFEAKPYDIELFNEINTKLILI
jgi:hypothetical protein